jgi:hypothetical protein
MFTAMPGPSNRFSLRAAAIATLPALVIPACDKLPFGGDDDKAAEATPTDDAAKQKAEEEAKQKAEAEAKGKAEGDAKSKAEEEAKQKAREEEIKKQVLTEEEAKRKAEEEASKPVVISGVEVKAGGGFGGGASLQISAKGKVNEKLSNSSYIHAKALCKRDTRFIADVGYLNTTDFSKQLHQYATGETADIQGTLFSQGDIGSAMSPCQVEFRLAGAGGGPSVSLATACYDGSATTPGPCEPPVVAAAMSGSAKPLEVFDLVVKPEGGFGGSPGLSTSYVLQVNEPQDDNTRLTLKTACSVGTTKFVDMGQANLWAGPFRFESGEAVVRPARLYWNPAFGFVEAPKLCDVTVAMWKPKTGAWGEFESTQLKKVCFKDGSVADGACDPSAPPAPAATAITAESLVVENVQLTLAPPYGSTGNTFQLQVQADATVKTPVTQDVAVDAEATCKVGSTSRVEKVYTYGIELHYLEPSETTRMSGTGFTATPLEGKPKSCEVVFSGGRRFGGPGDKGIELGRYCLKKDKIKKSKC